MIVHDWPSELSPSFLQIDEPDQKFGEIAPRPKAKSKVYIGKKKRSKDEEPN